MNNQKPLGYALKYLKSIEDLVEKHFYMLGSRVRMRDLFRI